MKGRDEMVTLGRLPGMALMKKERLNKGLNTRDQCLRNREVKRPEAEVSLTCSRNGKWE